MNWVSKIFAHSFYKCPRTPGKLTHQTKNFIKYTIAFKRKLAIHAFVFVYNTSGLEKMFCWLIKKETRLTSCFVTVSLTILFMKKMKLNLCRSKDRKKTNGWSRKGAHWVISVRLREAQHWSLIAYAQNKFKVEMTHIINTDYWKRMEAGYW